MLTLFDTIHERTDGHRTTAYRSRLQCRAGLQSRSKTSHQRKLDFIRNYWLVPCVYNFRYCAVDKHSQWRNVFFPATIGYVKLTVYIQTLNPLMGTIRRVTGHYTAIRWLPSPLLAVPNVTAHPSMASVPTSYYSMRYYNSRCPLKG